MQSLPVLLQMRNFGRVAFCGAISGYNQGDTQTMTVKNYEMILMRRLTVQGFICPDHLADIGAAFGELVPLVTSGQIQIKEDVREVSLEAAPETNAMMVKKEIAFMDKLLRTKSISPSISP